MLGTDQRVTLCEYLANNDSERVCAYQLQPIHYRARYFTQQHANTKLLCYSNPVLLDVLQQEM